MKTGVFFTSSFIVQCIYDFSQSVSAQTDCRCNIIFLSATVAADGADALRRISRRRLSAAVFRDLQPLRCTGCQVTVHRARLPDLLRDPGPGGARLGLKQQQRDYCTYRQQNNTVNV